MTLRRAGFPLLASLTLIAAACSAATTPSPSANPTATPAATADPFEAEWAALIAAAKAEGEIVIVGGPEGSEEDGEYYAQFGEQFGITTTLIGGPTGETTNRILAERSQNIFSIDVAGLGGSGTDRFLEAGVFEPLEPYFIHPDALDRSTGWLIDYVSWVDETKEFCQYFGLEATGNFADLWYNTEKVSAEELESIQSWQDLLDPKWKGRIQIGDIASGEATGDRAFIWLYLGEDWFDTLLRSQEPTVLAYGSEREYADRLIRGDAALAMFEPGADSLDEAVELGLPIALFDRTLSEGSPRSPVQRICAMMDAPHPNATKLFVNWVFTVEGQTAFNAFTGRSGRVALRSDVTQGKIDQVTWDRAHADIPVVDDLTEGYQEAVDQSQTFVKALFEELGIVPGS